MCHLRAWKEGRANLVTDTVKQLIGVRPDVRRAMDRGESGGFCWLRLSPRGISGFFALERTLCRPPLMLLMV
jgi:hypothetical protein